MRKSKGLTPYLLVIPGLFFVGILIYAVVEGVRLSLFQIDMYTVEEPFVGFQNYFNLFGDSRFQNSLLRSLVFVAGSVVFGTLLATVYALTLYYVRRGRSFFRTVSLVPYMVSGVAAAIMWRFLFSGEASFINASLAMVGVEPFTWLGDQWRALLVVTLANIWFISPFSILILLSGLQSIDSELFDSAKVEGASGSAIFRYITLPLIAPMMGVSLIWLNFASFNMFDIVLPLTGGGPRRGTELLAVYLYRLAFDQVNMSLAATVMILLLIINVSVSVVILRATRVSQ